MRCYIPAQNFPHLRDPHRLPMKTAIVTIAIGATYIARWQTHCKPGWVCYAQRHGFDVAGGYDRIIWIDSDILINDRAPSIADGVPLEKIGATDMHLFPSPQVFQKMFTLLMQQAQTVNPGLAKTWASYLDPADWHAAWGLPRGGRSIVQTGVLLLTPKHHRELLEHVYYAYEDRGGEPMNYENRPLSFEIQARGLLHVLDNRFNALLMFLIMQVQMQLERALTAPECAHLVKSAFAQSYFLHLAGLKDSMDEFLPGLSA
jgi:hypothetical protein